MRVKPVPDSYGTVTPCLYNKNAAHAIEFLDKRYRAMIKPEGSA